MWSWCAPWSRSQIPTVYLVYTKIQITFLKVYDGCAFDPTMDLAPWCSTKVMFLHWNMAIGHENNVRRLLMVYNSMCHLMLYNSKLWGKKGEEGKHVLRLLMVSTKLARGNGATVAQPALVSLFQETNMKMCCSHIRTEKYWCKTKKLVQNTHLHVSFKSVRSSSL